VHTAAPTDSGPAQRHHRPREQPIHPEARLADGERLVLQGESAQGTVTHTLQVVHTPGHAANHLCLVLEEDGLLFSGDHILNGSTTVIDPPDGNMGAYLDSLDRLAACATSTTSNFILPAHGYVLGDLRQSVDNPGPAEGGARGHQTPEGTPPGPRSQGGPRHDRTAPRHA
jgi:recombination protein RecT